MGVEPRLCLEKSAESFSPTDGFDFLDRGTRHDSVRYVMVFEMRERAFDLVDLEGASDALPRLALPTRLPNARSPFDTRKTGDRP